MILKLARDPQSSPSSYKHSVEAATQSSICFLSLLVAIDAHRAHSCNSVQDTVCLKYNSQSFTCVNGGIWFLPIPTC